MSRVDYPPVEENIHVLNIRHDEVYLMSSVGYPPITSKNWHIEYPSLLQAMQERWLITNVQRLCHCKRAK